MAGDTGKPAVALLGTGIMGTGMGRNLLRAGLPVRVWNRTAAKAAALKDDGATVADSPAEAVSGADVIVTMLGDARSVAAVMAEAAAGTHPGQVWAQVSTVGVSGIRQLARQADELGLVFVDCPVLGTRQPAEQGTLTVFAAGPQEARTPLAPVFDAIGRKTVWLGEAGAASRLKLVANSWVLAITNAAGESLALARGLDVDPQLFLDGVKGGPLDCAYLHAKAAVILGEDYEASFTVDMAGKDARLIVEAGQAAGLHQDVAEAAARRFQRAAAAGHGQDDMAAAYFASFSGA